MSHSAIRISKKRGQVCAVTSLIFLQFAFANPLPRVFLLDPAVLAEVKEALARNDTQYLPAIKKLRRDAEKVLREAPVSVMQKKQTPPSGDKHDYMSIAPYWWPDPDKPDGKPYIRRDGEVNPERSSYEDRKNIGTLTASVQTLSLAYYFTGDETYAQHATAFLRTWFLNPATRMNPNMNFAQAIIGRNDGRGAGLIETSGLRFVVDAVGLLETSTAWTPADQEGMRKWFEEYFAWLTTSKIGKDEAAAKNNHGTWYDVQATSIAFFLGRNDIAKNILVEAKARRIDREIEPDGRMPFELSRTKALGYSTMNINAFFSLAALADRVGIDLWWYSSNDGRSIKGAVEWIFPFWTRKKDFPMKQIIPFNYKEAYPLLLQSSIHFEGAKYKDAARTIMEVNSSSDRSRLQFGIIE